MSPLGLPTVTLPEPATVSLTKTYDVLVVGSGAAGGMAAHALTSHGLDVRCWRRASR
jgi:succinate dehydrogenase/fumarate reductase flavoprotein subunit